MSEIKKERFKQLAISFVEQEVLQKEYEKNLYINFIKVLPDTLKLINNLFNANSCVEITYYSWEINSLGSLYFAGHPTEAETRALRERFINFYRVFQKLFKEFIKPMLEKEPYPQSKIHIFLQDNLLNHPKLEETIHNFENKYLQGHYVNDKILKKSVL